MNPLGRLTGAVRSYDWGSTETLARLRGLEPSGQPEAELWLGAHPQAPALLRRGETQQPLHEVIAAAPGEELGELVADRFDGRLPYLLKVLAAARPLSLQAHPTRTQAEAGYEREEAQGIARDSPERTFRDRNHKPELVCALEPFTILCGFRPLEQSLELLSSLEVSTAGPLCELLGDGALAGALAWVAGLSAADVEALVGDVAAACAQPGPFPAERSWASRLAAQHPGDPGVVTALLLHLVVLAPGQAVFLGAGSLHAYLGGTAVEIMASSDNVLRGGLTSKHVDVPALLEAVDCTPLEAVDVQSPVGTQHTYRSPVPDFSLTRVEVEGEANCRGRGPEILLNVGGRLAVNGQELTPGEALWLPAGHGDYRLSGTGLAFRANPGLG